jgi:hypothetical protein
MAACGGLSTRPKLPRNQEVRSMPVVQMDDRLQLIVVINQPDVAAKRDIAMVGMRSRIVAGQIGRRGVHPPAQVLIEHSPIM